MEYNFYLLYFFKDDKMRNNRKKLPWDVEVKCVFKDHCLLRSSVIVMCVMPFWLFFFPLCLSGCAGWWRWPVERRQPSSQGDGRQQESPTPASQASHQHSSQVPQQQLGWFRSMKNTTVTGVIQKCKEYSSDWLFRSMQSTTVIGDSEVWWRQLTVVIQKCEKHSSDCDSEAWRKQQ